MSRPQNSFQPYPTPKIAHLGPKSQKWPQKLSENQKLELKELQKINVVQLDE